jgi:hypothetical protein
VDEHVVASKQIDRKGCTFGFFDKQNKARVVSLTNPADKNKNNQGNLNYRNHKTVD